MLRDSQEASPGHPQAEVSLELAEQHGIEVSELGRGRAERPCSGWPA